MEKVCKDYMLSRHPYKKNKGCTSVNCKYIHDDNLCYFFYKGDCKKEDNCKFNHFVDNNLLNNNSKKSGYHKHHKNNEYHKHPKNTEYHKYPKNTETFEPNYTPPDMRILYDCSIDKCKLSIQTQDVIIAPNLFCDQDNFDIYNKLLDEMKNCGIENNKLWKLWHGDTHLIADDHLHWSSKTIFTPQGTKNNVPTFHMIIDKISKFFNMEIKATRFNFYRDNNDWKPFHHDAAAVKPEKAKTQNFTVGISFGYTRDIAFEDALNNTGNRRIISIPLPNGSTYCFTRDININWKHGVLPLKNKYNSELGRISIIAWGFVNQYDLNDLDDLNKGIVNDIK